MLICSVDQAHVLSLWEVKDQIDQTSLNNALIDLRNQVWERGVGQIMHGVNELIEVKEL